MIRSFAIAALSAATVLASAGLAQAETVGTITDIRLGAYSTPPGGPRALTYAHNPVVSEETLETVNRGALSMRFVDNTELTMGSSARMVIDRLVYDPSGAYSENPAISLVSGAFRMVSGRTGGTAQPIALPYGTIGIRGTTWTAVVDPETGASTIKTVEGLVSVTSSVTNQTVDVPAGFTVSVGSEGMSDPSPMGARDIGFTGDPGVDAVSQSGSLDAISSPTGSSTEPVVDDHHDHHES